jgi:hypothetical protein
MTSFDSGLGDVGLSQSSPVNTPPSWAPEPGTPVTFDAYPVLPGDNGPGTDIPENTLDYMGGA